jgi:hypothetical protein
MIEFKAGNRNSKLLAIFVLYGPIIFPFLTDYEKMYLMRWFVNVETSLELQNRDEKMHKPRLAPIIRFAMLCKKTYLKGNVTPRPLSDGEFDLIPRGDGRTERNPTRSETISMLNDLQRLGCNKRRLSFWLDPINIRVRRIFAPPRREKCGAGLAPLRREKCGPSGPSAEPRRKCGPFAASRS